MIDLGSMNSTVMFNPAIVYTKMYYHSPVRLQKKKTIVLSNNNNLEERIKGPLFAVFRTIQ